MCDDCLLFYLTRYEDFFAFLCRNFENLIPDAPELIHSYLEGEADASCKRNAFMMLIHVDRVRKFKKIVLVWDVSVIHVDSCWLR